MPPDKRVSSAVHSVDERRVVDEERGIEHHRRRDRQHPDADADALGLSNRAHIERKRQRRPDELTAKAENTQNDRRDRKCDAAPQRDDRAAPTRDPCDGPR